MADRQQGRQGVIYGPARPSGSGSGGGAIIGRLIGLIVVVLAVAVLAVGAVAFIGDRPASPSQPPTAIAQVSPTPSLNTLPTAVPTPATSTPTIAPTPTSSGSIEPGTTPGPTAPLIQVGPGFVTFGTRANSELRIVDPRTSFTKDERIVWSAYLIDTVNSADVRVVVLKDDEAAPGGERLISDDEVTPERIGAQVFVRKIRPARLLDGPGMYTVRYLRGDRLMSEGYFLLTE